MKADTVLDFAVFQLTPTRTRCELLISHKGVTEKLASGLLKPFLAHLRTAEEQIAVGGYSIRLEPPLDGKQNKATWFTKGTMQRFVRFVSTPEVLERVSAVESELIQLEDELNNYNNEGDDQQSINGSVVLNSGGKAFNKYNKPRRDSIDDVEGDGNETSKCRLIKAMEARYSMLQREQGMAFARAVAAGFDMDHLSDLLAFAECFGAARLSEACHKFAALCKKQQEGGLWLDEMELVAAEGAYPYSESNGAGITIAPAGLDPLITTSEMPKHHEDSKGTDDANHRDPVDNLRRQSSGYLSDHPQMMGMPPGQMPGYAPWMHFNGEQGYDPRFFPQGVMQIPQNLYMNGYSQMPPYWGVPPPPGPYSKASSTGNGDEEDDEEPEENNTSKKAGKKSSPRRRSSSPLKKLQVGRGKRSGMVLIRNINYITSQESAAANKNRSTGSEQNDNSDESSEFETSSEFEHGKQHPIEDSLNSVNGKSRKKSRRKKFGGAEVSSEGSHASTSGDNRKGMREDVNEESFFTVPERTNVRSGATAYSFDTESIPGQHTQKPSDIATDESYFLNGGRGYGTKGGAQYGVDEQMRSSNLTSKDGMLLPQRDQAGRLISTNHDSELSFRNAAGGNKETVPTTDDSFIIPERAGLSEPAHPIGEAYQVHNRQNNSSTKDTNDTTIDELFIVPSRHVPDNSEVTRRTLELEMPNDQLYSETKDKQDQTPTFEPEDIWMLPERSVGKDSMEKRWNDVDYDMEVMASMQSKQEPAAEDKADTGDEFYDQYHEQRDAKLMKESGSKKAEREARMKSLQDTLDKRKAELSSRFKSTRSSILKSRKEKEEAERKRIEELAAERRNRIAARTGGGTASKPQQTTSRTSRATTTQRLTSTQRLSGTGTATKPPTRTLTSTPTNKDFNSTRVKKTLSSRNALSKSVPSLAELRKENTRPTPARQQGSLARQQEKTGSKTTLGSSLAAKKSSTPTPTIQGKRPTSLARKSIATVRELQNPEASKVGDSKPIHRSTSGSDGSKQALSSGQDSSKNENVKTDASAVQAKDMQEKSKVTGLEVLAPGNDAPEVVSVDHFESSIALSPNSSSFSSHLQSSSHPQPESTENETLASQEASIGTSEMDGPEVVDRNEDDEVPSETIQPSQQSHVQMPSSQQTKDSTKGFKKLLKFGRKSRQPSDLLPEDEEHRQSDVSSKQLRESGGDGTSRVAAEYTSSIPAPPDDFKLRDDRISSSSFIKAPRSFFSMSTFRSKEAKVR